MNRKAPIMIFFFAFLFAWFCLHDIKSQFTSRIVYPGDHGKLIYEPYTDMGDVLPDFSYCGYKGGGVAIPDVPVKITLFPTCFSTEDNTRIQEAIDQVGAMPMDANGFRGAVLLKKGRYNIRKTLYLIDSGVVLRGEGDDSKATVLVCTRKKQYDLFHIGTNGGWNEDKTSRQKLIGDYIPSGSKSFRVADAFQFKVGDEVIIERPSTQEWISYIGMDKIMSNWISVEGLTEQEIERYKEKGLLNEDETMYNATEQWTPGSRNLFFQRVVTSVKENMITVDVPITNAMQREFGGGYIYRYTYSKGSRPEQIGIEYLRAESVYNSGITKKDKFVNRYFSDENHAFITVSMNTCRNVWIRNVSSVHFWHGFYARKGCSYATIQDCNYLDPVSEIRGGRRYGFNITGQMCLAQRCFSRNARHDSSFGANVAGPNAFVDLCGVLSHASIESHERWATGGLFDNCSSYGPRASLNAANRGSSGTGHGWTGAQMVFWNCKSRYTLVMKPPTAENFSIGNYGVIRSTENPEWMNVEYIQESIDYYNRTSGRDFQYEGIPVIGDAYIELTEQYVTPQYLYYKQLWDRLGEIAVMQVTTQEQQKLIFY